MQTAAATPVAAPFGIEALREQQDQERTERPLDQRLGSESAAS